VKHCAGHPRPLPFAGVLCGTPSGNNHGCSQSGHPLST
jgi:hypothetical protein